MRQHCRQGFYVNESFLRTRCAIHNLRNLYLLIKKVTEHFYNCLGSFRTRARQSDSNASGIDHPKNLAPGVLARLALSVKAGPMTIEAEVQGFNDDDLGIKTPALERPTAPHFYDKTWLFLSFSSILDGSGE